MKEWDLGKVRLTGKKIKKITKLAQGW